MQKKGWYMQFLLAKLVAQSGINAQNSQKSR